MSCAIIVTGGRDYKDRAHLFWVLDCLDKQDDVAILFEGGAAGADRLAHEWASDHGVKTITVSAEWELYGKSAGPRRNKEMLKSLILANYGHNIYVVAFPGGAGTANMCALAEKAGIPVIEGWEPGKENRLPGARPKN